MKKNTVHTYKRALAVLLALMMVFTFVPMTAMAAEGDVAADLTAKSGSFAHQVLEGATSDVYDVLFVADKLDKDTFDDAGTAVAAYYLTLTSNEEATFEAVENAVVDTANPAKTVKVFFIDDGNSTDPAVDPDGIDAGFSASVKMTIDSETYLINFIPAAAFEVTIEGCGNVNINWDNTSTPALEKLIEGNEKGKRVTETAFVPLSKIDGEVIVAPDRLRWWSLESLDVYKQDSSKPIKLAENFGAIVDEEGFYDADSPDVICLTGSAITSQAYTVKAAFVEQWKSVVKPGSKYGTVTINAPASSKDRDKEIVAFTVTPASGCTLSNVKVTYEGDDNKTDYFKYFKGSTASSDGSVTYTLISDGGKNDGLFLTSYPDAITGYDLYDKVFTVTATFAGAPADDDDTKTTVTKYGGRDIFNDVPYGGWYYKAVYVTYDLGLISGTGKDTFSPDSYLTRGMAVTMFGREAARASKDVSGTHSFWDVDASKYYAKYVGWASANGIVTGYTNGSFLPDQYITREEAAAMMVRFLKYMNIDVPTGEAVTFSDNASIGSWAGADVRSAAQLGMFKGYTDGTFKAKNNVTRAEFVQVLTNYLEKYYPTLLVLQQYN